MLIALILSIIVGHLFRTSVESFYINYVYVTVRVQSGAKFIQELLHLWKVHVFRTIVFTI